MAMQAVLAQGTAACVPYLAQGGGLSVEHRETAVHGRVTVGTVNGALRRTAPERMSVRIQSRRIRTAGRAEPSSGGEVSTTTIESETCGASTGIITEVDNNTFWPIVKSAGEKVVVLDMYTQWCGPCKLMLPKIQELAETMDDVYFCKLDCNQENKPLAKQLGIRVVPTFKIFKRDTLLTTITGAKYHDLLKAIEEARSG